jgi:hypothetical protein
MSSRRYQYVHNVIDVLQSMKEQAKKDIEILLNTRREALENPIKFIQKLVKKESLGLPTLQYVPDVPIIDWEVLEMGLRSRRNSSEGSSPSISCERSPSVYDGFYHAALDFGRPISFISPRRNLVSYLTFFMIHYMKLDMMTNDHRNPSLLHRSILPYLPLYLWEKMMKSKCLLEQKKYYLKLIVSDRNQLLIRR